MQYWTDSNGSRTNYRWDVDKIVAPNEGPSSSYYRVIKATYVQDKSTPTGGYTTIRDAALQQIIYGDGKATTGSVTDVAGTVDFAYHGPNTINTTSGDSSTTLNVAAYGNDYNCEYAPQRHTNHLAL